MLQFFQRRKSVPSKLLRYGFERGEDGYGYQTTVMDGQFLLRVSVDGHGTVSTQMIDSATQEEYSLYRMEGSTGAFVGEVRAACEAVVKEISQNCFEPDVFHSQQAQATISYVRDTFGDALEYLWKKFPDNAVWRRKDSQKWYGAILTVSRKKLGFPQDELVEIIDLKIEPEKMAETVDNKRYFPGWHMNKKSWYTIVLDGSVPTADVFRRIDHSYGLAAK